MKGGRGILTLAQRELKRFYRQRGRVTGTLGTPLVLWVLLGAGFGKTFQVAEAASGGYLSYFFPGVVVLQVLFTAVFANIAIIEDRREGFLQSVLVAPVPRWGIVLGQVVGGSAIALLQAALMLCLLPWLGIKVSWQTLAGLATVCALLAVGFNSLGCAVAWWMNSSQGFHAFMNLVLIPLWMLSGAVFPASGAPEWLQWIMTLNPLSYGVTALRQLMGQPWAAGGLGAGVLAVNIGVTAAFAVIALLLAWWRVKEPS